MKGAHRGGGQTPGEALPEGERKMTGRVRVRWGERLAGVRARAAVEVVGLEPVESWPLPARAGGEGRVRAGDGYLPTPPLASAPAGRTLRNVTRTQSSWLVPYPFSVLVSTNDLLSKSLLEYCLSVIILAVFYGIHPDQR